jgi:hypothetical protein
MDEKVGLNIHDSYKKVTISEERKSFIRNEFEKIDDIQYQKARSSISEFQPLLPVLKKSEDCIEEVKPIIKKRRNTKGQKMLRVFKKQHKEKKNRISLESLATKEKVQIAKELRSIFKSDSLMTNNIKSLQKERKINDTIVALISFIIIILCFYQMYLLIDAEYYLTDKILTIRTCILILSIPNSKNILKIK